MVKEKSKERYDLSDELKKYLKDYKENNVLKSQEYYNKTDTLLIHFQNKDFQDFQFYRKDERTYYFKQDYNIVKLNDIITKIAYTDLKSIQVSLIDNTECYLKKGYTSLSGYNFVNS